MELIKIFSGSEVESMAIAKILSENNLKYVIKNNVESARLAGFGNLDASVEIYINEEDSDFWNKINSKE
jgi:hypothetical protein